MKYKKYGKHPVPLEDIHQLYESMKKEGEGNSIP
jgi:hypothetical protein